MAAIFTIGGIFAVAAAVLIEVLPGSSPGFGRIQWLMTAAGALLFAGAWTLGRRSKRAPEATTRVAVESTIGASDILVLTAWIGLVGGLFEALLRAIWLILLDVEMRAGPNLVWMAPIAYVILLAVPGAALAAMVWSRRKPLPLGIVVASLIFLAALLVLEALPAADRISFAAKVVCALGIAVTVRRVPAERLARVFARPGRPALFAAGIVALLGLGVQAARIAREAISIGRLAPSPEGAPNVLLIILDTVRAASLSLYGYERPTTPFLEHLARESVVFDRAIATSPWTLPSHSSMFTGRFPDELSANWEAALDDTYPTIAEILGSRGYSTGGFVANRIYAASEFGLDRGFQHYEDYPISLGEILQSSRAVMDFDVDYGALRRRMGGPAYLGMKDQREISRSFLRWLDRVDDRPFFAFLNYFDAHAPYLPPAGFDTLFGSEHTLDNPRVGASREWEEAEVEAQRDAYDGSIAGLDGELRLLLGELESRGSLDNTIVIITSDHGEHFGEHGFMGHAKTLYMPLLHVPLLIRWPSRVSAGARVATPVSLRDLAATILDLARIDHGGEIPGRSLSKHWTGSETGEPQDSAFARAEVRKGVRIPGWYPVARGDMHSLVSATHHYIKHADGREELYAYFDDPDEEWNLADRPEASEALQRFRNAMASIGRRRRAQDRDAGH